jgi:hypothetical protein
MSNVWYFWNTAGCNCHDFFDVRIGISDGKGIIFNDINNNYNIAGNPINLASRVMGMGDRQQILLTEEAYRNMIDMTENTDLESKFVAHGAVDVKHNITLGIHQYIGQDDKFLNAALPLQINIQKQMKTLKEHPVFSKIMMPRDQDEILQQTERMGEALKILSSSKSELAGVAQMMEMVTSNKPEDMDSLRELATATGKLMELRKTMFKDE